LSPACMSNSATGPPDRKLKLAHRLGSTLPEAETTAATCCVEVVGVGVACGAELHAANATMRTDRIRILIFFMIRLTVYYAISTIACHFDLVLLLLVSESYQMPGTSR
jgi:hypothetical protein